MMRIREYKDGLPLMEQMAKAARTYVKIGVRSQEFYDATFLIIGRCHITNVSVTLS